MKINDFVKGHYQSFYKKSFELLKGAKTKTLILDLRDNGGGTSQADHFNGEVYVLINGGSFSATTLLAANLKSSGRAVFVGEETGGAYNGCVAGSLPVYTTPNSKLPFRMGVGSHTAAC